MPSLPSSRLVAYGLNILLCGSNRLNRFLQSILSKRPNFQYFHDLPYSNLHYSIWAFRNKRRILRFEIHIRAVLADIAWGQQYVANLSAARIKNSLNPNSTSDIRIVSVPEFKGKIRTWTSLNNGYFGRRRRDASLKLVA